jgi:hypothetical protein
MKTNGVIQNADEKQQVARARHLTSSVVSHLRVDNRRDPLPPTTSKAWGPLLASADENGSSSHPLPQGRPFQNSKREVASRMLSGRA